MVCPAAKAEVDQIRMGPNPGNSTQGQSIISGEHIDTSNLKGVPVDPTMGQIAGLHLHISCLYNLLHSTETFIANV